MMAFIAGLLLGGSVGVLGAALLCAARAGSEEGGELQDTADPRFQAGYAYGLMIGHERGWRDAERGRVA